jgi:hypothetical protein
MGGAFLVGGAIAPTARQDKRLQRFEIFLAPIDQLLEPYDLISTDPIHAFLETLRRCREFAAEVKQFILDLAQHSVDKMMRFAGVEFLFIEDPRQTDGGIELIDNTESIDPWRIFRDALTAHESGLAAISRARVNFGDADSHWSQFNGECKLQSAKFKVSVIFHSAVFILHFAIFILHFALKFSAAPSAR